MRANFLRLVEPSREPVEVDETTFARRGWQNTLFAHEHASLLIVAEFDRLPASDFLSVIASGKPKLVLDLRRVPRFDISHLNRRLVFDIFAEKRVDYVDLSALLWASLQSPAQMAPAQLAGLAFSGRNTVGPIVLLVDQRQADDVYISEFVDGIPSPRDAVWDVLKLPLRGVTSSSTEVPRNLVFISHANPEDNAFTAWLAGKLAISGYCVWSDITRLIGGELFWDDIEDAIRHHAAKVIVVLSKASQTKAGVLDEIDLAIRVERHQSIDNFVVPVRLGDLPFVNVRANLSRKNIIDFNASWVSGLSSLLDVLSRDGVIRTLNGTTAALPDRLIAGVRARSNVARTPEKLITNWLPVREMPPYIDMVDLEAPVEAIRSLSGTAGWPTFPYLRLLGMFADGTRGESFDLSGYRGRIEYRISLPAFLTGNPRELPGLTRQDAHRHIVSLVRQGWDSLASRRGLHSFRTASGGLAWFPPQGIVEGDWVNFIDGKGIGRRKKLVGWSERRQVFWHAAVSARLVLAAHAHMVLRQHVVFTEDGRTPIAEARRMHALRRTFCRSWWNDRWRDLFLGVVHFLSEGGSICVPVGATATVVLDGPLKIYSPVSPESDNLSSDDEADLTDLLDGPENDLEEERLEYEVEVEAAERDDA